LLRVVPMKIAPLLRVFPQSDLWPFFFENLLSLKRHDEHPKPPGSLFEFSLDLPALCFEAPLVFPNASRWHTTNHVHVHGYPRRRWTVLRPPSRQRPSPKSNSNNLISNLFRNPKSTHKTQRGKTSGRHVLALRRLPSPQSATSLCLQLPRRATRPFDPLTRIAITRGWCGNLISTVRKKMGIKPYFKFELKIKRFKKNSSIFLEITNPQSIYDSEFEAYNFFDHQVLPKTHFPINS
jgi:hypothetical protein